MERTGLVKPVDNNLAFSGTICEKTTNQSDYIPKYVKKTIPFKESEKVVKSSAPLNDKSTHQYDFTKKKIEKIKQFKPSYSHSISTDPFNAISLSHQDYVNHEINKTVPIRPSDEQGLPREAFEILLLILFYGTTEHRANFYKKLIQLNRHSRHNEVYQRSINGNELMEKKTTYLHDYVPVKCHHQSPFRPKESQYASHNAFMDLTTHACDYINRTIQICPAQYVLTRGRKSFKLVGDSGGHRFYQSI
ncbi:unnamed protein product [Dracunculus medinensis]|uniref:Uncharacterized protein n=1 Tax=Dracunculus medinensis TaxID=318479 RepID=A0A0N4U8S4_DRAME|nr:unnamed protein product [Dracunculus medinensis]